MAISTYYICKFKLKRIILCGVTDTYAERENSACCVRSGVVYGDGDGEERCELMYGVFVCAGG